MSGPSASKRETIGLRSVRALQIPSAGEARLWDDRLAGFCVRAYAPSARAPEGRKVYCIKYRVAGRQGWHTIGEHGKPWRDASGEKRQSLTPDMARDEAERVIADAKRGDDPRAAALSRRKAKTVAQLIDTYLAEGPKTKLEKRASSWDTDRANLQRHIRPTLGERLTTTLKGDDITTALADIAAGKTARVEKTKARGKAVVKGGKGVVPRVLSATKAMFTWAIKHGHHNGANPCVGIKLPKRAAVERFLSDTEAAGLLKVLDDLQAAGKVRAKHADIFRLLALTGARRAEIEALRWREVDLDRGVLVLPPQRTKTGEVTGERRIALNRRAVEILEAQPRGKSAFVFAASKGKSGHTTAAPKVWRLRVRPAAKLAGLRIHDLRHSFASFALADGASLPMIGKALGHRSARSTERYAHLGLDPLQALAEAAARRMGVSADPEKKDDDEQKRGCAGK